MFWRLVSALRHFWNGSRYCARIFEVLLYEVACSFRRMRDGRYEEGQCVLRAKIDMAHSNINMRDPIIYRILKKEHPRTGTFQTVFCFAP